jgi:hypothetical protein
MISEKVIEIYVIIIGVKFKALRRHFPGGTGKKRENNFSQNSRSPNRVLTMKSKLSTTMFARNICVNGFSAEICGSGESFVRHFVLNIESCIAFYFFIWWLLNLTPLY